MPEEVSVTGPALDKAGMILEENHKLTMGRLFWKRVVGWNDQTAMREKVFGIWKDITWKDYGDNARLVCMALTALGLEKGDRVTIISENCPEWLYCDMGIMAANGITVGIYTTDSTNQIEYIINHCDARFYIAEDEEQLDKLLTVRDKCPSLEKIIVFDMEGLRDFSDPMVMSFDELLEMGREHDSKNPDLFEKLLEEGQEDETAILIYTSGTTGPPKGAMISHKNIIDVGEAMNQVIHMDENDEFLTFLPLCHIAERTFSVFGPLMGGQKINFAEGMDTVPQDIREVSPTVFFAVPRIWEKFHSTLTLNMQDSTGLEKLVYNWAIKVGESLAEYRLENKEPPVILKLKYKLADLIALKNVKKATGLNRVRLCFSGAAPISPDLLKFYYSLGLEMREGYGQTESTALATFHYTNNTKFGTVGQPMPEVTIKIAEDGEILIKGPNVFKGYWADPEKTKETIIDGWLYSGDVGSIDEDGHIIVSDRKKDIIITAGGKNITPSEIENQLKFSPYINDAVVIGDGRKFLSALIMIDDENVMKYAQDKRVPFSTYASLTKAEEVVKLIEREVEEVNKKFAHVETIKKFRLLDILLTEDDDEITPTMKLKRSFVSKKFKDLIDSMY